MLSYRRHRAPTRDQILELSSLFTTNNRLQLTHDNLTIILNIMAVYGFSNKKKRSKNIKAKKYMLVKSY